LVFYDEKIRRGMAGVILDLLAFCLEKYREIKL
jgi:hypothetical protein